MTKYNKEYYELNKHKIKQNQLRWNKKNRDRLKKNAQKYAENNREKILLTSSKQRAEKSNIEHTISEEDIIIPELCPFLNIPLTTFRGRGRQKTNASIDRIDSTKGYIPGNIQIISDLANRMKQDASQQELITFAQGVLRLYDVTRTKHN